MSLDGARGAGPSGPHRVNGDDTRDDFVLRIASIVDAKGNAIGGNGEPIFAIANQQTIVEVERSTPTRFELNSDLVGINRALIEANDFLVDERFMTPNRQSVLQFVGAVGHILIIGPSLVGKSSMVRAMALRSSLSYCIRSACDLQEANISGADVLVIDDLDDVVALDHIVERIRSLLISSTYRLIIGIVTDVDCLPVGIQRRFPRRIRLPIPTSDQRKAVIMQFLSAVDIDGTCIHIADLASRIALATPGFVAGDLKRLFWQAWQLSAISNTPFLEGKSIFSSLPSIHPMHTVKVGKRLPSVDWSRFAGYRKVKQRLQTLVRQWSNPQSTRPLITGVLLYGPSGTGKTLAARAIASEKSLNFVSVNAGDILSKYLGDSEARLRCLFKDAAAMSPCVLFFDEIDALGRTREGVDSDDGGVQQRILSTLLNEMDGIEGRIGVFILGASNRVDAIDAALIRPGRFDMLLEMPLPEHEQRLDIVVSLMSTMSIDSMVDPAHIAAESDGMSGADISLWCREAGLCAIERDPRALAVNRDDFALARSRLRQPA